MSKSNPNKFSDLNEAELASAAQYFGVEVGNKDFMVAGFADDNISWEDYLAADVPDKPKAAKPSETGSEPVDGYPDEVATAVAKRVAKKTAAKEETVTVKTPEVVTADREPVLAQANYLIKMERKNPLFEFGQYKFTKEDPYNIMPAEDAQRILTKETGFRQAFPDELREYYS